jgi:predicted glycogen debranching enzyme
LTDRAESEIREQRRPAGVPWSRLDNDALQSEWLLSDGHGGYGCGTVADVPMRRYHAWLVSATAGAGRRRVAVAGADERIATGPGDVSLLAAHWRGATEPALPPCAVAFRHLPHPCWTFTGGGFALRRELAMDGTPGRVLVRWTNLGTAPLRLSVLPFLSGREVDHLLREHERPVPTPEVRGASWALPAGPALPPVWLCVDGTAAFLPRSVWYRGFELGIDRARGYDHVEDRWSPGALELLLGPRRSATAAFSVGSPCGAPSEAFAAAERRAALRDQRAQAQPAPVPWRLARGADDFLYTTAAGRPGVLAGFPWFGEWGRDVFVALPGLTLARGDRAGCAAVLRGALPFLKDGLLPNIYGDDVASSHYGSADAALWFALAVQRWADGAPEKAVEQDFLPALRQIADACQEGTGLGLRTDSEGLLYAGSAGLNATWMDARTDRGPVTPRFGQPVEINALWYSLLALLDELEPGQPWRRLRDRAGAAFVARFWLPDRRYLADRWTAEGPDVSVRPNMVIAAALPLSPLQQAQRAAVVAKVDAELLTPRGLRTLSPQDPAYRGRYQGGPRERDEAYHQGTAWPWLFGFHAEAALRGAGKSERAAVVRRLRQWLLGIAAELDRAGLDHTSEVFDGDEPQRPGGSFAQAWNTGELLRAHALLGAERRSAPEPGP